MCGLVGVASPQLTDQTKKAFYEMLYLDVVRGEDSTGVAAVANAFAAEPSVEVFKSLGAASDFFWEHGKNSRDRSLTNKPVNIFIGHNRFATQGAINVDNAHPFEFDNVVGAHNGTCVKWSMKDFHGYKEFDVDSQIIYSQLSHTGSIDSVWADVEGAMALVWWDKTTKNLKMIRNKERPLIICYADDDKTVFWASEWWMIYVAAMRQGIKLKEPIHTKPDRLYTFFYANGGLVFHQERDLPPFVVKPYVNPNGNYGGSGYWQGHSNWYEDDYAPPPKKPTGPVIVGTPTVPATPKPAPSKNGISTPLVIREFHNTKGCPSAGGFLEDGTFVRIIIPLVKEKEAKDKIVGRGCTNGYYMCDKLYKNHGVGDHHYWCHWSDLNFFRLKAPLHLIREENNGFSLPIEPKTNPVDNYAPWFDKANMLTQSLYTTKVTCGCLNCKSVPNWGDKNSLTWVDRDTFFCFDCAGIPLVKDLLLELKEGKKDVA